MLTWKQMQLLLRNTECFVLLQLSSSNWVPLTSLSCPLMARSPPQFAMNYHPLIVKIYSIKTKVIFVIWLKGEGGESVWVCSFCFILNFLILHYFLLFFNLQCQIILFNCLLVCMPLLPIIILILRSVIYFICPYFPKGITNFNHRKAITAANSSSFSPYAQGIRPTESLKTINKWNQKWEQELLTFADLNPQVSSMLQQYNTLFTTSLISASKISVYLSNTRGKWQEKLWQPQFGITGLKWTLNWGFVHLVAFLWPQLASPLSDGSCWCRMAQVLGQCSRATLLVAAVTAFLIFLWNNFVSLLLTITQKQQSPVKPAGFWNSTT